MKYIKTWRFLFFCLYMLLIIYFSSKSQNELGVLSFLLKYDMLMHFIEYLVLGFLIVNIFKTNVINYNHWQIIIIFLFIFPLFDECVQIYTPNRVPDLKDAIVDIIGGYVGAYLRYRINA